MRSITLLCLLLAAPAFAQRAPGAPTQDAVRAQLVRLQVEIAKNDAARRQIDAELRELERRAQPLRIEQQRLANENARLQSELLLLQQQAR